MSASAAVLHARLLARIRLRHLQLLVAIADHGTLKRAAEQVGMSQPAATQAIRELERLLEAPLFERQARGMRTTEAGRLVLPVARQMSQALGVALKAIEAAQEGASGLLRVGAIPAAVVGLVAPALSAIVDRHARLHLQIFEGRPAELLSELAAGSLHLVLTRRPAELGSRYAFESLCDDEAVVVASPRHPLAGPAPVGLEELAGYPWLVPPAGVRVRALFDEIVAECPPKTLHRVSTSSPTLVFALLGDHRTVTLAPASIAQDFIRQGLVARLPIRTPLPMDGLGAVYPAGGREVPALAAFLDMLGSLASPFTKAAGTARPALRRAGPTTVQGPG